MEPNAKLIQHLVELLRGGHAHATFDQAVKGAPIGRVGERPPGAAHSVWELVEHIRIAQHDILQFSEGPKWKSPHWPQGYWPKSAKPKDAAEWRNSLSECRADLKAFERLLKKRADALEEPFAWGDGQTLLREALLIADHNAYHIGQIVLARQLLGIWPGA
jgi:uncharacterized damage-inducible protein DinB